MSANDDLFPRLVQLQFRNAAKAVCKQPVDSHLDDQWSAHIESESCAQVDSLVRPQVVSPKYRGGLKPKRKKPCRLMGRFSEAERNVIYDKAAAIPLSVNEYIRAVLLGPDYKPPLRPELYRHLLDLYRELSRQGNNLNQIARQLNAGIISPEQAETMLALLAPEMLETHRALREALAHGQVDT